MSSWNLCRTQSSPSQSLGEASLFIFLLLIKKRYATSRTRFVILLRILGQPFLDRLDRLLWLSFVLHKVPLKSGHRECFLRNRLSVFPSEFRYASFMLERGIKVEKEVFCLEGG